MCPALIWKRMVEVFFAFKQEDQKKLNKKKHTPPSKQSVKKCHIVGPHIQGIRESFKSICGKYGVTVHFKGVQTLKNIWVSAKDKETMTRKNGVLYWYRCDKIDIDEEYIGESSRMYWERYREHLKAQSPIFDHQMNSGYITTVENFRIIGRKGNNMARAIKEVTYNRVNSPTLNRNIGQYNLPHIWVRILYSTP